MKRSTFPTTPQGVSNTTKFQHADTTKPGAHQFGFSFDVTYHEHGFFDVYFDSHGNVVRVVVHHHVDFVLTAIGKSLFESDNFISIFTADNIREIGSFAHIQGDHAGIVLRDAGQIVFDAQDNLLYV